MVTRALARYIRMSSKKLQPITRLVNKKRVDEALYILVNANKKGAKILKGVVESALSNAKRIPEGKFTEEKLYISKVAVNQGPTLKRYRAMSMGRAGMIRKRTCHILVELDRVKEKIAKRGTEKK